MSSGGLLEYLRGGGRRVYVVMCGEMLTGVCFARLGQADLGTGKWSWGRSPPFYTFYGEFCSFRSD